MALIGFYRQKAINVFTQEVMYMIESGQRGDKTITMKIDGHIVTAAIKISSIVFVDLVTVTDRQGKEKEDVILFGYLRNAAMSKLTDRLVIFNALNHSQQKQIREERLNQLNHAS